MTSYGALAMHLVIFDVDGTLVDSQHHILEAQRRALGAHGLDVPDRQTSLSVVGLSLQEAFVALAGPDAPAAALAQSYKDAWFALRQEPGYSEPLYPGAADTIAALAADPGTVLGLATGKSRRGVDRLVATCGWQHVFATVQTSDEHPSKPHPSMVLAALAETGVPAEDAVVIGDTTFDVAMASAAGVRAIGVTWGYHDAAALRAAGAGELVNSFAALQEALATPRA